MKLESKGRRIIETLCWMLWALYLFNVIGFGMVFAGVASYIIMLILSFFAGVRGREKEIDNEVKTQRQRDFANKVEGGNRTGYDAEHVFSYDDYEGIKITMVDKDNVISTVRISPTGKVKTTGHPNPDVIEAASMLNISIINNGIDAVMAELDKQVALINQQKK